MISESGYWKNDLLRQAKFLRKKAAQKRWTESTFVRVEQSIMMGFYAIRKLIEARKISDSNIKRKIQIKSYSWSGKLVTWINLHRVDMLYDFSNPTLVEKDMVFICNQFIHSYIFMTSFNRSDKLAGILFNSDKERNKALYYIKIKQIVNVFELVGNDYPVFMRSYYDPKKQDYTLNNYGVDDDFHEIVKS